MREISPEPDSEALLSAAESVLLVSGEPVGLPALSAALGITRRDLAVVLQRLQTSLTGGIRLQIHENQVQLVTAPENGEIVQRFLGAAKPPGLSRSALETLTIIAYRQPVTRSDIEAVRGVNSDRAVQTLLARNLIEERGHRQTLGRPTLYGTSFGFLEYFGLQSLNDLPPIESDEAAVADPGKLGMRSQLSNSSVETVERSLE